METESRHVSVFIERLADDVYRYASDPAHLPDWAAGLATGVSTEEGRLFADSPMGRIEIAFAPPNRFGVLDHEVTTPDGTRTYNPMRVLPAGDGCEVVFSIRRRGRADPDFQQDAQTVLADLQRLARNLDRGGSRR